MLVAGNFTPSGEPAPTEVVTWMGLYSASHSIMNPPNAAVALVGSLQALEPATRWRPLNAAASPAWTGNWTGPADQHVPWPVKAVAGALAMAVERTQFRRLFGRVFGRVN